MNVPTGASRTSSARHERRCLRGWRNDQLGRSLRQYPFYVLTGVKLPAAKRSSHRRRAIPAGRVSSCRARLLRRQTCLRRRQRSEGCGAQSDDVGKAEGRCRAGGVGRQMRDDRVGMDLDHGSGSVRSGNAPTTSPMIERGRSLSTPVLKCGFTTPGTSPRSRWYSGVIPPGRPVWGPVDAQGTIAVGRSARASGTARDDVRIFSSVFPIQRPRIDRCQPGLCPTTCDIQSVHHHRSSSRHRCLPPGTDFHGDIGRVPLSRTCVFSVRSFPLAFRRPSMGEPLGRVAIGDRRALVEAGPLASPRLSCRGRH